MNRAKKLLREAKRPERSVQLCLRGDLTAQMEDLDRQLVAAQVAQDADDSVGATDGGVRALAEQIEQLRHQMQEHTLTVTVRAVPRQRWTQLVADHPPRDGHRGDQRLQVNEDEFFEAIMPESIVDPKLDDEDWSALNEALTDGQWVGLTNAVWGVNRRDVDVPFSPAASRILATSAGE